MGRINSHDLLPIARSMYAELSKIAEDAGQSVDAPSTAMQENVQQGADGAQPESSPSHGIVAARVEQLSSKKARGIPIIQAPPGYVYAPNLQSFVQNTQDPGWMQVSQQAEASKAKAYYDKGVNDSAARGAQQEMDSKVHQSVQQVQQQAVQRQQAQQRTVKPSQAQQSPQTQKVQEQDPRSVATRKELTQQTQASSMRKGKGVTIKIGK